MNNNRMEALIEESVCTMHRDLAELFSGRGDKNLLLQDIEIRLDSGFTFVNPHGRYMDKSSWLSGLEEAWGSREDAFDIEVEMRQCRALDEITWLVLYWETQGCPGGKVSRRITTALFRDQGNGQPPLWMHLHDTYLS